MTRTAAVTLAAIVGCCAGAGTRLEAHRVDEFLQAARVTVAPARVILELDLTPGIAVAASVLSMIDRDGNGEISSNESNEYGRRVIDGLVLTIDGERLRPRLDRHHVPSRRELQAGMGSIRLVASAALPVLGHGHHELHLSNRHRADIGVYLANAMLPDDPRIVIDTQRRDVAQHELSIDYTLAPPMARPPVGFWTALAAFLVVLGFVALKRAPRLNLWWGSRVQ